MKASREHVVEDLNRGNAIEVDLDWMAENDDGKCGCAVCLTIRRAIAEGHRGSAVIALPPELQGKLR